MSAVKPLATPRLLAMHLPFAAFVIGSVLVVTACGGGDGAKALPGATQRSATTGPAPSTSAASSDADLMTAAHGTLEASDLGPGWTSSDFGDDRIVPREISCLRFSDAGLVETANYGAGFSAGGPTLILGGKVFVRSTRAAYSAVKVLETEAQARTAFRRFAQALQKRPILRCLFDAESVRHGPTIGRVSSFYYVVGRHFPRITEQTWREQYAIQFAHDRGDKVWIDVVLLRESRMLGLVFFSSVEGKPFPEAIPDELVKRTATVMGDRMSPGPGEEGSG